MGALRGEICEKGKASLGFAINFLYLGSKIIIEGVQKPL